MTIIFLWQPSRCCRFDYSVNAAGHGVPITVTVLVAASVCLIPTTIGGSFRHRHPGNDRMIQAMVIALSGRAVEAAGMWTVLLLDKDRDDHAGEPEAGRFLSDGRDPQGVSPMRPQIASLADRNARGAKYGVLAKDNFNIRERDIHSLGRHVYFFYGPDAHEG